jgi:hypothetical protein
MAIIHFCGGEVGGNGKTTFASLLIECYLNYEASFQLRDADRSTPNVGWAYDSLHYPKELASNSTAVSGKKKKKGQENAAEQDVWEPLIFSEDLVDFSIADKLISLGKETDLIINLPSQVRIPFDKWFDAGDFSNKQERLKVNFIYWWVAKPEQRSIDLLLENVDKYPNMPHVLVCNQLKTVGMDWKKMLTDDLKRVFKSKNIVTMDMPELILSPTEKILLGEDNPRFCDLIDDDDDRLSIASKCRCEVFLEKAMNNIIATGYFSPPVVTTEAPDPVSKMPKAEESEASAA